MLQAQHRHPVSGRVIAPVMGVGGAEWLERPERESEEAPSMAIQALQIQPGQVVADIGAGSGYYTVRLAREVGPTGKVYGTDIQPGMLDLLRATWPRPSSTTSCRCSARPTIPGCRPDALDLALMVDVYHELAAPQAFIRRLRAALKRTAGWCCSSSARKTRACRSAPEHKMSVAEVRQELEPEGFR